MSNMKQIPASALRWCPYGFEFVDMTNGGGWVCVNVSNVDGFIEMKSYDSEYDFQIGFEEPVLVDPDEYTITLHEDGSYTLEEE